jgi:hypothetical protein
MTETNVHDWNDGRQRGSGSRTALFAGGALAAGLLLGRGCASGGGAPELEEGVRLQGVVLPGEKPMSVTEGILVGAVDGAWARLHFGDDDETGRWINFEQVTAFAVKPEAD